jgi:radical SAM superfamily enzyme YgiQ (UPF0313 family)
LLCLAAYAKPHHDIRILDLNLLQDICDSTEELFGLVERETEDFEPRLVGFYTMANVYPWVIGCSERLKVKRPETFVVLGGEQATLTASDTMAAFPFVDAIVRGEGEVTFAELLVRLERGESLDGLPGLTFRENGAVMDNPNRGLIDNLDELPLPAYELVPPITRYQPGMPICRTNIITSRGCPYECKFCSVQVFWDRRVRYKSHARVIEELRYLRDTVGSGFIDFADDTFTVNMRHAREFCRELIRADLGLEWFCRSRVDRVDEELLSLLRQAGCSLIFYGAESGSPQMLDYVGKGIDREQILQAVRATASTGLKPILSFIYGFPDETRQEMETSIAFARSCLEEGAYWISFQRLTALPGTPIADRITGQFDLGGAYIGGSDRLRGEDFIESVRPMIRAHPTIFPSYYTVMSTAFRDEAHLQETFQSLLSRYGLRTGIGIL